MVVGEDGDHHPQVGKHSSLFGNIGAQLKQPTFLMEAGVQGRWSKNLLQTGQHDNIISSKGSSSDLLKKYIELQAMLGVLTVKRIRRDFLGQILDIEEPELMLFTLDHMRKLLMPTCRVSSKALDRMASGVVEHVKVLAAGDERVLIIPTRRLIQERSYREWMEVLQLFTSSKY